jgi:hypothetical protein
VLLFAEKVHADYGPRQRGERLTPLAIPPSYKKRGCHRAAHQREARSMDRLKDRVNQDIALTRRGRFLTTTFLVEVGPAQWLVSIVEGKIASVTQGPFVMPSWSFALRASQQEWQSFWSADPRPGSNDLMALIKRRVLKAEGNLHIFMANLRYFKESLEKLRPSGAAA